MKIGIDFGNVISGGGGRADTNFFTKNFLQTPEIPFAIGRIMVLCAMFESENVYIVSKCGDSVRKKTREWLENQNFWSRTGINPDTNLIFVYKREDKAPIAKQLGLDVFIDDRLEILESMEKIVPTLLLFNPSDNDRERFGKMKGFGPYYLFDDWIKMSDAILGAKVRPVLCEAQDATNNTK